MHHPKMHSGPYESFHIKWIQVTVPLVPVTQIENSEFLTVQNVELFYVCKLIFARRQICNFADFCCCIYFLDESRIFMQIKFSYNLIRFNFLLITARCPALINRQTYSWVGKNPIAFDEPNEGEKIQPSGNKILFFG